jgi:hypothetical protein
LPSLFLPASPFEVVATLNYLTPAISVRATKRTERLQDLAQTGPGRLETPSAS